MLAEILLFSSLLALSAFFSGSETAYFSLSKLQIKELDEEGGTGARVADLLRKPQQLLIMILIGNTLVNTATAALAAVLAHQAAVARGLSVQATLLIEIVVVTVVLVLVSEVTPKVYAIRNGASWARRTALPLMFCNLVLWPLVRPVMAITRQIRKLISGKDRLQLSSEELKALLEVGHEEGHLEEDEKKMIHSIFEFGETTVREVMVPRIDMVCLPNTALVEEAVELIRREGHSRVPIYRERVDNVTGILYAKDLIPCLHQKQELSSLDQLARLPYFVPEGKKIDELLHEFQTGRMHMAIVVDEYGGTAGLVTLEDILEEIVGEIQDEFDAEAPQHRRTDDGSWVIDSSVLLEDVNNLLEEEILPTAEDYETLGGFIYQLAGEVPRASSSYQHLDWRFTVMTMKRHRIGLVKAERLQTQDEDEREGSAQ